MDRYKKLALIMANIPQIVLSNIEKIEDGKKMLGDDILLRLRGPINTYKMMVRTIIFAITPHEEKLSLRCWSLLIMLATSLVSRFMTVGSSATHHKEHRKHDYSVNPSTVNFRIFSRTERTTDTPKINKGQISLSLT